MEAAFKGSKQIGFTIISLTISLIAVLIPLLFMADVVGRLFREFADHACGRDHHLRRHFADAHPDDVQPTASPGARRKESRFIARIERSF